MDNISAVADFSCFGTVLICGYTHILLLGLTSSLLVLITISGVTQVLCFDIFSLL